MEFLIQQDKGGALIIGNDWGKGKNFEPLNKFCMKRGDGTELNDALKFCNPGQVIRIEFLKQCKCGEYV